ncbi:MAG TPA: phosphatase PAP2 family protein [Polyangiaceae bacterium]|nr:phosphatase PAP2 family protein [Polyangiaceae bacterium]
MAPRNVAAFLALLSLGFARPAEGECNRLAPWNRVGTSLAHFTEPLPVTLAALSPLPLMAMAPTGVDHDLRLVAQEDLGGRYRIESVSNFTPYVLAGSALVAFGVSAALGACEVERPLSAILQGMAGGFMVTGVLKWSVGRQWPNGSRDPNAPDRLDHPEDAYTFHPFQLVGAWPSGHTLSMFAAAAAFRAAEDELGWPRFLGYPLAAGVAAGMWLGDRHWASDILSGALLGEAIGSSVGQSFAQSGDGPRSGLAHGTLVAIPLSGGMLATWLAVW